MAGLPPGDPQLVSMIVNHLKTQGLFDQFRRDCLADVDTKPAYLNLKQRVDNFVSNHLSNHTWSPHLNKNQLRNNIRQLVLQSGMLEQGVDRIVTQVVDPKINHIFRPQVERVVREFLSPGSCSQELPAPLPPVEIKPDGSIPEQASLSTPTTTAASDAMSILDTITSLNQEASVRASSATEKCPKGQAPDDLMQLVEENVQDMNIVDEGDGSQDGKLLEETEEAKVTLEVQASEVKTENTQEQMELDKEGSMEDIKMEQDESGAQEDTEEEKDRHTSKISGKPSEEKQDDDDFLKSTSQAKQKARERIKEEYSLEDSDLEGLSDITVSSVHTSDLSSFEEESDEEEQPSDSSEEGELSPDDQIEGAEKKHTSGDTGDEGKESKPRRKAYVHKPFLYSRYYSDSDDEITVEERRRSAAKEKEERLLKRQQNRERMEEKRKQKAALAEEQDHQKQKNADSAALECPKAKEARKERKVLEKKMALNRKRKLDSRKGGDVSSKKKGNTGDITKKAEGKSSSSKTPQPRLMRNLSESASSDEKYRRMSGSISEDSSDTKKLPDKGRTHSFILDLEQGSQEALKQRSIGKFDRLSRKELHSKERKDKERSLSDERTKLKQKQEKKSEHQLDESQMKEGNAVKISSEEKSERKPKIKSEKKMAASTREGKVAEGVPDEGGSKDAKKMKVVSGETVKAEKEKEKIREKDKIKEKEKAKAEKSSVKSDFKLLVRPDSAGSSEDRSDLEPGSDGTKKREKHSKEVLKRSKSHTEDKPNSGDKLKSKIDCEKEKTKADQDSQKLQKSSSETDKDPKRVKTTEKGKITEKPKVKSKEEAKIPLSLKTDKKVQSSDVKSAGGASIIKPEATKEKRKDGNVKEQRRVTEETSHEKSDPKSSKKKLEKKDKVPEKKDDSQEEKTTKEEKFDKSEKSSKSSSVSLSLETEQPPKKQPPFQETSTDSDPVTTTVTTSISDDTCDALSDITPEPPEGETESRLGEIPAVPAENDALLTLMDVCTSAEARLPTECLREEATPKIELQDADMKMKEAALTLLSMDPDSTMSSSLICQDTRDPALLYDPDTKRTEVSTAEEAMLPPVQVQSTHESELSASETSSTACQQMELIEEKTDTADEPENSGRKMDTTKTEMAEMVDPPIKEDDVASNTSQISSIEKEAKSVETPHETQLDEKMAAPVDQEVRGALKSDLEEAKGNTEVSTAAFSNITEQVSEIPGKPEQTEPDFEARKTNLRAEEEENQTEMVDDKGEAECKNPEENVPAEEGILQRMETNIPNTAEEVESESKLVKQISNVSSTDSPEDERSSDLSEKEEKKDGRGRHKRKLSCQKGDKNNEKEGKEQLSAEETEKDKVLEVGTPRRGRSSRTTEEAEKDQQKEPEKSEKPPSRRERRSGAAAKEPAADNQKKDESRVEVIADETSLKAAEKDEKGEDNSKPKQTVQSGIEDNLPSPVPEDSESAGSSNLQETTDTRKPVMKRKRSEEMEESSEEAQAQEEIKDDIGQGQDMEQLEKDSGCSPASQSEDVKEEVCSENKADDVEEDQQEEEQEDQEATPKKPVRRGRPSKAASAEDSDKKDKKTDEKDSEQNDEEEEEEGDKEGDEKGTATRATTRSASRLEAEKNKPSKPSTRASRQNGKEETTAGTRGTRGQAASKGGRKREASPPAVRTRGGQKSEELPSKRAKR